MTSCSGKWHRNPNEPGGSQPDRKQTHLGVGLWKNFGRPFIPWEDMFDTIMTSNSSPSHWWGKQVGIDFQMNLKLREQVGCDSERLLDKGWW